MVPPVIEDREVVSLTSITGQGGREVPLALVSLTSITGQGGREVPLALVSLTSITGQRGREVPLALVHYRQRVTTSLAG